MKYIIRLFLFCSFFSLQIKNSFGQDFEIFRTALEDINLLTLDEQVTYNVHSLDPDTNEPLYSMDALHVMELKKQSNINTYGRYVGVYHHKFGGPLDFEIHLATSEDLMSWTFRRVLLTHADMPYILRSQSSEVPEEESWIILAHEEWQTNGNCKLAFKTYYDEDVLLSGSHSFGYTADITLSDKGLEGTPSIYSAELILRNDRWVVDLNIGFHYNKQVSNEAGARDMVGTATLTDFGNNSTWATQAAINYMDHITLQGATGNVGQRDFITINNSKFVLQEGNIQGAPYDKWDFGAWRLWIYKYKNESGVFPAPSTVENINFWDTYFKPIFPRTHNRSTSFGNPSIKILTNPNDTSSQVLFTHFFIFGEGAAMGETGPMIFFKELDSQLFTTSISALFGKWHLGEIYPLRPQDSGFEKVVAFPQQGIGTVSDFWTNDYFDDVYVHNDVRQTYTGLCTDIWFSEAIKWIDQKQKADEPFLCVIPTNVTHGPYFVAPEWWDKF